MTNGGGPGPGAGEPRIIRPPAPPAWAPPPAGYPGPGYTGPPAAGPASAPISYPMYVPGRTSGPAVASLVLGIVWVFWIGSILAVVFGHVALSQIKRSYGAVRGRGLAVAGLVLGYLGVATLLLSIVVAIANPSDQNSSSIVPGANLVGWWR